MDRRGTVLFTATILVFVVLAATAAFLMPSLGRYRATIHRTDALGAFFEAEAGISHAIVELDEFRSGALGSAAAPVAYGEGAYYTETADQGDGTYTIVATGIRRGVTRRITSQVKRRYKSIWDNALIAGPGQSGRVIAGNVTVHGGIYVFGEYSDGSGDISPDSPVIAFSGTAGVKDNYQDLDPALAPRILPLSTRYPLWSEVRVKNGRVDLDGTAALGQEGDRADGVFLGGNYGGNQGEENVYSDNGAYSAYDMPDSFTLPSLEESYYDVSSGTSYDDYDSYASSHALQVDGTLASTGAVRSVGSGPGNGTVNAMGGGSGCDEEDSWGVTKNAKKSGTTTTISSSGGTSTGGSSGANSTAAFVIDDATPAFTIQDGATWESSRNRIRWTPSTRLLEVDGVIQTNYPVVIGSSNTAVEYRGRATLYSRGASVDIHADILPTGTYPTVDVLGIMSAGDCSVGTGPGDAQLELAVVLYAEKMFRTEKQSQIAGAIMASYFDMGVNVPQLFAIPSLKDNLPPGWMFYPPVPTTVYVLSWMKH